MRDAHVGQGLDRMREDGRYAQRMDVSDLSYGDSDRKMRLRKLIDSGKNFKTIGNENYSSTSALQKRSVSQMSAQKDRRVLNNLYNYKQVDDGRLKVRKSVGSLPPMEKKITYLPYPYNDNA